MSTDDPRSAVYHALKHDLRRGILSLVVDGPKTYTELLKALEVESGLLAYHLRNLGALIEKDADGRYVPSGLGMEAISLMEEPRQLRIGVRETPRRLIRLLFVVLMVFSVLSNAYLVTSLQEIGQWRSDSTRAISDETLLLVEDSLSTIYSIYERMEIDRGSWTELLLNTVQIRTNLHELDEMAWLDEDSAYGERAASLNSYVEEFARVLKSDDRDYFDLTIEKRYMIRELQSDLLSLREHMSSRVS